MTTITIDLLNQAYERGWIEAACWAKRDDLCADVGSPAYIADREPHLDALREALQTKPVERKPCVKCGQLLMSDFTDTCYPCNQAKPEKPEWKKPPEYVPPLVKWAQEQAKPVERNFCPRCGKRMSGLEWDVHTCTPPTTEGKSE